MADNSDAEDDVQIISSSSNEDIQVIGEVSCHEMDDHMCDLCCKGKFLIDKLLRFGGLINEKYKFVCDKCDKNFTHKSKLQRHAASCTGPVNCEILNKDASPIVNAGKEPKICTVCHSTFKNQGGLTRHMQAKHSGITHKCAVCKASFSSFKQFTSHCFQHEQNRHKEFICNVCHKGFSSKKSLSRHQKSHCDNISV